MKHIQVFLITRNRPDTLARAIDSVLNQSYNDYELIVSDNSTNDQTHRLIETKYLGKLIYRRRIPQYDSGVDHINKVLSEVESELFMIFHDDDEMLPEMLETLVTYFNNEGNNVAAVGANAYNVKEGSITGVFLRKRKDIVINSTEMLMRQYLNKGIVPFPSFMYKKGPAMTINTSQGGKYSDVAFLVDVLKRGNLVYCCTPLMKYYRHFGQDSATFSYLDSLLLVNYLKMYCHDKALLYRFRLSGVYLNMKLSYPFARPRKGYLLLLLKSPFNYFIKYNIYKFIVKAKASFKRL